MFGSLTSLKGQSESVSMSDGSSFKNGALAAMICNEQMILRCPYFRLLRYLFYTDLPSFILFPTNRKLDKKVKILQTVQSKLFIPKWPQPDACTIYEYVM